MFPVHLLWPYVALVKSWGVNWRSRLVKGNIVCCLNLHSGAGLIVTVLTGLSLIRYRQCMVRLSAGSGPHLPTAVDMLCVRNSQSNNVESYFVDSWQAQCVAVSTYGCHASCTTGKYQSLITEYVITRLQRCRCQLTGGFHFQCDLHLLTRSLQTVNSIGRWDCSPVNTSE